MVVTGSYLYLRFLKEGDTYSKPLCLGISLKVIVIICRLLPMDLTVTDILLS